mmetsp:Transcript_8787/g.13121  ORF Transcript_8787/g.13121 Transcript_8787/m.13121 type:complete len:282 (-) Transcript_8787:345-1190(-)|eukprot:CAMPEP_0167742262 /NCGR_PEP_ID=MMETSP0110_2-20121227/1326_1 /TAXON_ID=629695 /ORGANISM="Gymnochlora sp., Strain CCMP2014" /LENGTH=281 /DNA_ID=CAMNT_0007626429 /DNA_START=305 /DNA_END=1153 /DNA_ORIENTATION=-
MAGESKGQITPAQEDEVNRIMTTFILNPFEILNLNFNATKRHVSNNYHRIAALVHPDKCSHTSARTAFERAKNAHDTLMDNSTARNYVSIIGQVKEQIQKEKRSEIMSHRRSELYNSLTNNRETEELDEQTLEQRLQEKIDELVQQYEFTEPFTELWKSRVRKVLVRAQWAAQRMEEFEESKQDRKLLKHSRKLARMELEQQKQELWEQEQDDRINTWQEYKKQNLDLKNRKRLIQIEAGGESSTIPSDIERVPTRYQYPDGIGNMGFDGNEDFTKRPEFQ